jgi:hypothetical protein
MLYDHESSIKALCQEIVDFNEFIFGDMEIFSWRFLSET